MMNEMVERVARAIYYAGWPEPPTMPRNRWEALSDEERALCRRMARAAIAAMREPTEEMVDAAGSDLADCENDQIIAAFRAMIDAALIEGR